MRSSWTSWVGSESNNKCPIRDTQKRHTWGEEEMATWRWRERLKWCSHKPVSTWGHQEMREARSEAPLELLEGAWPCPHLDFGLWPPELWENTFLLRSVAQCVVLCYSSHRELIHAAFCSFPSHCLRQVAFTLWTCWSIYYILPAPPQHRLSLSHLDLFHFLLYLQYLA